MEYIKKRLSSIGYALTGIKEVFGSQVNAKIHLLAAIMVILAGIYFKVSTLEWGLLVISIVGVFAAESLNTAIEHLTDLVSPEYHPLAKKTKDAAAGGVLWIAIGALLVGGLIFLPKIF